MKNILSIVVLLFLASPCLSDITEYDIEIVIFEDITNKYLNSERWPHLDSDEAPEKISEEIADEPPDEIAEEIPEEISEESSEEMPEEMPDETPFEFFVDEEAKPAYPVNNDVINITDRENQLLEDYASKIISSNNYNLLLHKSWRQSGLDAETAINISIDSREETKHIEGSELNNIDELIQMIGYEDSPTPNIRGSIKIILGRYLHLYTDLTYSKPWSSFIQSPIETSGTEKLYKDFAIKTHRKMRSRKLHYIDHPLVGLLVIATPVDKIMIQK